MYSGTPNKFRSYGAGFIFREACYKRLAPNGTKPSYRSETIVEVNSNET